MAGRRTSLAALAGAKVDDVPGRSDPVLLSLPLDKLHCTRFNPRRNFGTDEDLRDFGEKLKKEQLQPAVVVSRAGYLKLWPDEAERVGTASYVIANGERRYRASRLVGRGKLEVVHREDVAASRASFLDAVQSENNDRQDLDPIERAIAIETMVTELGGADKVAAYYSKTKGWVSQQRKLLKLTAELQNLVSAGDMPIRVARDIAGLPEHVQAEAWQEHVERRRLEKETGARLRAQSAESKESVRTADTDGTPPASEGTGRFTAVNQRPPTQQTPDAYTAVYAGPAEPAATSAEPGSGVPARDLPAPAPVPRQDQSADTDVLPPVPAQTAAPAERQQPKLFPYTDGDLAAQLLIHKMPETELGKCLAVLQRHREKQTTSS
ncbi:ParB N-terminal domain-containing protein [Streptomyces tendae]|uniref:ParB/RepB/Spo0J family partition protein n=1 Tax=Streptomyces tendae TaxID=1932 RepID=UPI003D747AC8